MTDTSPSEITNRPHLQTELFRSSLQYPSHSYAEILFKTAERYPENEAVIFKDVNLSYRELDALVNAFANTLLDLGIQKGDRVSLLMTKQKIVDIETGQIELGVGEVGELIVQGPQIMQGYWKAPDATTEALRDGWLYTGDIGWRDEDGYVTVTDRKKEMIKFKGFSVARAICKYSSQT